jgi:hypothetical protein
MKGPCSAVLLADGLAGKLVDKSVLVWAAKWALYSVAQRAV